MQIKVEIEVKPEELRRFLGLPDVAGLQEDAIADCEAGRAGLDFADIARLRDALERGGAVFIDDDSSGGIGVRLKFNAKDVRAINRMEGEGGPVGTDDV